MADMRPVERIKRFCTMIEGAESRLLVLSETLEAVFQHELADYIADIASTINGALTEIDESILALEKRGK